MRGETTITYLLTISNAHVTGTFARSTLNAVFLIKTVVESTLFAGKGDALTSYNTPTCTMNHAYATRTFAGSTSHASVLTKNVVELTSNFVKKENGSKLSTVDCHSN